MDDGLEGRIRDDGLVKGILLGNVFDNGKIKLVRLVAGVSLLDLVGLGLGTNGGDDTVATLKEDVQDVCGDEARASSEKNAGHCVDMVVSVGFWYFERIEVLELPAIAIYVCLSHQW